MNKINDPSLSGNARRLRSNMTKEERHLWYDFLKTLPVMVHRQKVIGRYIVDFYIAECKTVIEIDGSQHYADPGKNADAKRDADLQLLGLTVLRYSNADISCRFRAVCEDIYRRIPLQEVR